MRAWIARRRDLVAMAWLEESRLNHLLAGSPAEIHAEHFAERARRRLARWDWLLAAVTGGQS